MATYSWAPPVGSNDLWSTPSNWIVGGVTASVAPGAGDTAFVYTSGSLIHGPGIANLMTIESAYLDGAFQAGTVDATFADFLGSPFSANTLAVTGYAGGVIFSGSTTAAVTGTIAREVDLGVAAAPGNIDPATNANVLDVELGTAAASKLTVNGAGYQLTVKDGAVVNVGSADMSAGFLDVTNGGVMTVGAAKTMVGLGGQSLGLLEVSAGGAFSTSGTTVLGYASGALGELKLDSPGTLHPIGTFTQNGAELDVGDVGTGEVQSALSDDEVLNLIGGASLRLGLSFSGAGYIGYGLTLNVTGSVDVGVLGYGEIGNTDGGDVLAVTGNVNVGVGGTGRIFTPTGTIGTTIDLGATLDLGVGQYGTGYVSLDPPVLGPVPNTLIMNGGVVVGDAGQGHLTYGNNEVLTVNNVALGNDIGSNLSEIGAQSTGTGEVDIHSGALLDLSQESLTVGDAGQGTLAIYDPVTTAVIGTKNQGTLLIGNQAGSYGTVIVEGGSGLGLFSWSASLGVAPELTEYDAESDSYVVVAPPAAGNVYVAGPGSVWDVYTELNVGVSGYGVVTVTGGATLTAGELYPNTKSFTHGLTIGANGFVTVEYGGTLVVNGAADVYGTLNAGGIDASGAPRVYFNDDGYSPLSDIHGEMTLSDLGTILDADDQGIAIDGGTLTVENSAFASVGMISFSELLVGNTADAGGTLDVLASGTLTGWAASVGAVQDSQGTALVDDGTSDWLVATTLTVGGAGAGTLTVSNGGTVTVGDPADTGQFQGLIVGDTLGITGTVDVLSASSLEVNGGLAVGNSGTGVVTIAAGSTFTLDNFDGNYPTNDIGSAPGASGTLVVTDTGSAMDASTTSLYVGDQGDGTLVAENGGSIAVGNGTMVGGVPVDGGLIVGDQATGTGTLLVLNGGTLTSWQDSIGQNATAHGTVTVDGANSVYMPEVGVTVGNNGTAGLSITNGGAVVVGDPSDTGQNQLLVLGQESTGVGSVTVDSGSMLDVNGGMALGNLGTGVATIAGGSTFTLQNFDGNYPFSFIGNGKGSSGTLVVTDPNTSMDASTLNLSIGDQGNGTLIVENAASADIGSAIYAAAFVGNSGTGAVSVLSGGTVTLAQGITLGNSAGAFGTLVVSGAGSLLNDATGAMTIGNNGTGAVSINAGGIAVVGTAVGGALLLGGNSGAKNSLTIGSGGTLITALANIGNVSSASGTATVTGAGALWTDNGILFVGELGSGTLAIANGGSVGVGTNATFADVAHSTGQLLVAGAGSEFSANSTLRLGAGKGLISVTAGGIVTAGTLAIASGDTVSVDTSSMLEVGPSFVTAVGGMVVESGALAEGAGTILAAVRDDGTITASGGTLELAGSIIGAGTLDDSGTLRLDGGVASSLTLTFDPGTLFVASPLAMDATIVNFGTADTIEFIGSYGTLSKDFSSGTLDVFGDGTLVGQFDFGPGYNASNLFAKQGGGLVSITTDVPCFAAGTRIATPRGEVAVETLAVGDEVLTQSGVCQPVIWIGCRHIDCARHAKPSRVWPVCVAAGAFGPGRPHDDLFLSPDHAVYINEVLIPIRHLINGATIAQVPVDRITYRHIELPQHDVVLAQGLPAESYLDTKDGSNYASGLGPVRLYPDFSAHMWEAFGYARLIVAGPELTAARALVARYALEVALAPRIDCKSASTAPSTIHQLVA